MFSAKIDPSPFPLAGAIDMRSRSWRTKSGQFLFPQNALAKVFRAKWFEAMKAQGWRVNEKLPEKWVVDCKPVGNGDKALVYLSRYLYRGVIREKDILGCENGEVTFRYTENSGQVRTRTLAGADFLWLLLQHVLPKGFRRSRDYGLLHGNAKQVIQLLQLLLKVFIAPSKEKPPIRCRKCGGRVKLCFAPFQRNPEPPERAPLSDRRLPIG